MQTVAMWLTLHIVYHIYVSSDNNVIERKEKEIQQLESPQESNPSFLCESLVFDPPIHQTDTVFTSTYTYICNVS